MKETLKMKLIKKNFLFFALVIISCHVISQNTKNGRADTELGIQLWTFHKFTFTESIEKTLQLGIKNIEIYFGQKLGEGFEGNMDFNMDESIRLEIQDLLNSKGLRIVACGVVKCKDEAEWMKLFEFAYALDIKIITTEPDLIFLDLLEKLATQYRIDVAIHNHPKPSIYWSPEMVMEALEGRSQQMGVCADVGHWKRMGVEPVKALKTVYSRLKCLHIKDIEKEDPKAKDVIWGEGVCNIQGIIHRLLKKGFKGLFSIEYENNWENSLPDIEKCIEFHSKSF